MKKAVLLSIRPEWCELIAIGKKTVEVRKTAPKLQTPFKCYIYETQGSYRAGNEAYNFIVKGSGRRKVIGEFICDAIEKHWLNSVGCRNLSEQSCVPASELHIYAQPKEWLFGWHISNLVIYDTPKELSDFYTEAYRTFDCPPLVKMKRPPQSWMYVEEL